jgi:hypothetical protein
MSKASDTELAPFAKLLDLSLEDVRELLKKGIVQVKEGKLDSAQSLLAVTRYLLSTRDTAEAKARAAQADAALKENRLKAASESRQKDAEKLGHGKWSKAAGERVCKLIETGKSLRQAAKAEGVTAAAVLKWVKRYPDFGKQYAQACELKYNLYADELDDSLNEADRAALDPECGTQRLTALRLRIDTRKWQLGKMLPKVYGDRTQMVVEAANPADLLPKHTAEQDGAFLRMLADIQAKTPPPVNIAPSDE